MSSAHKKIIEELTCKPLHTLREVLMFLEDPPPWRTLCKELTPHSQSKIKNTDINTRSEIHLDEPENFCHFSPDVDDPIRSDGKQLPKTLVCHDMANGYHDDCYIDGTANYDAYTFYNWAGIDIFCYFSHQFITIPPLGWINVGHAHGVKVIGTVITEWAEGIKIWDEVLASETEYQNFASMLVAIAKTLKFDGWLLNIENKVTKPGVLIAFVQYLNTLLHEEIPHAELIWYDSVTVAGTLNWQNALNDKNRAFFDACDGIFLNYSWTEFDITSSSIDAADRITDLYVGIDVWGRNFYGGGQFNTQEAVKLVHEIGCSLAIFAPAWTHEAMSAAKGDMNAVAMGDHLSKLELFQLRDRALWGSLWPFLNTRLPCVLPFTTSFCRGQGKKRRIFGEVISPSPWYNLRHQQYQPNSAHGPHGYVLSTEDNILAVSRHGIVKDSKGIIRYRESFQAIRTTLLSTKPKEPEAFRSDSHLTLKEDNTPKNHELKAWVEKIPEGTVPVETVPEGIVPEGKMVETIHGPRTITSKMKDVLRHVFHMKASDHIQENPERSSPEQDDIPASGEMEPTAGPSSNYNMSSSGRSMVKMSVNLRLGQGHARQRIALACVADERECLELYQGDSFTGGACLRVHPSDVICREHRLSRLFHCDFSCEDTLVACVVTKPVPGHDAQYLNVKLAMKGELGVDASVVLVGRFMPQAPAAGARLAAAGVHTVAPLQVGHRRFKDLQRYLLLNVPGFYVPVENSFGWTVKYYEVHMPRSRVTAVNVRTGLERGSHLLGHFGLCHKPADAN